MDGVLVVDKPEGMTSHDVVAIARRRLGERRIGHTGTLDPLATGVLPLACGRATRLVRFLSASVKEYEAVIRFGVTTDSYDITGTETSRTNRSPTAEEVESVLPRLRGEYLQTPPAFSAKKVGGRRAYALARDQKAVPLAPVRVTVWQAELRSLEDGVATIAIRCSAGFYVRAFAHTLGELVGTGACLQALRRTRSGTFTLEDAVTITELQQPSWAPPRGFVHMDGLLTDMPAVRLTGQGERRAAHGQTISRVHQEAGGTAGQEEPAPGAAPHGWVRLLDRAGRLIAVARPAGEDVLHPAVVLI